MATTVRQGEGVYQQRRRGEALDDWLHRRYHAAQADRHRETVAKELARRAGVATVRCLCGTEFPSKVEG